MNDIIKKLRNNNKTIATMESCTGGGLANEITNHEGSSDVFRFGAVTYSNEAKIKFGVSKETIDKYSVYSVEVSKEMSENISLITNSDYGIGITGKLNRVDKNNEYGLNNRIFISIYKKETKTFYTEQLDVSISSRIDNKSIIISKVIEMLNEII